jgi:drug/metabolite transporter (DMT)-like permease
MEQARTYINGLNPTSKGLLWAAAAGLTFVVLNTQMRYLSRQIEPFETLFLRYVCGTIVILPFLWRSVWSQAWPNNVCGQFVRGGYHTFALTLWFIALPHIPLADMTAIGFTTPIFIMLGAWVFLNETMRWERWLAAAVGFVGVVVVVAPGLSGQGGLYNIIMLCTSPLFAGSFLMTKALTKQEKPIVIVLWQGITVSLMSLPLALWHWQTPDLWQCAGFMLCGGVGTLGHYFLTRSYEAADISATQSLKFLELVWASLMGWIVFSDVPTSTTLMGGVIICASTVWVARREARRRTV